MRNKLSIKDINLALEKIKDLISEGEYTFIDRGKNLRSLFKHFLTVRDAIEIILDLNNKDYYDGPKSDYDYSQGEIWEFIKRVNKTDFYIKLKIEEYKEGEFLICISFRESERRDRR